jgi:hypothetical protein
VVITVDFTEARGDVSLLLPSSRIASAPPSRAKISTTAPQTAICLRRRSVRYLRGRALDAPAAARSSSDGSSDTTTPGDERGLRRSGKALADRKIVYQLPPRREGGTKRRNATSINCALHISGMGRPPKRVRGPEWELAASVRKFIPSFFLSRLILSCSPMCQSTA